MRRPEDVGIAASCPEMQEYHRINDYTDYTWQFNNLISVISNLNSSVFHLNLATFICLDNLTMKNNDLNNESLHSIQSI